MEVPHHAGADQVGQRAACPGDTVQALLVEGEAGHVGVARLEGAEAVPAHCPGAGAAATPDVHPNTVTLLDRAFLAETVSSWGMARRWLPACWY